MTTISELYEAFGTLNLKEALPAMIEAEGDKLVTLITDGQLIEGKGGDGTSLLPDYASVRYSKKKYSLNPLAGFGIPDLKVNGKYYAGIKLVIISESEYDIQSPVDWPSVMQYGDNALTPSEESKEKFCDEDLGPAIGNYILEKTGLVLT